MSDVNTERFLTVDEVAAELRVSGMTVYRLIKSGGLRGVQIGHQVRIERASLEAYLAERVI